MISGRYRSEHLCINRSRNTEGFCLLSSSCSKTVGNFQHILSTCNALQPTRVKLMKFTADYCNSVPPPVKELLVKLCDPSSSSFCQFLLDCSILPPVISATQQHDGFSVLQQLFHVSRTWTYTLHRERMKQLGRWNPI